MMRCRVGNISVDWDDIVQQGCSTWIHRTLKSLLCCLILGLVVYNLWLTRNELIHVGQPCTQEQLLKKIVWEIINRIAGKGKFPRTRENLLLCSSWNLPTELHN
jgi:hypothetical protein